MKKPKTELFNHAISDLDFSGLGSDRVKIKNVDNLRTLSSNFYFQMNDFLALLSRTEKHLIDDKNEMIKQINHTHKQKYESTKDALMSDYLNKKRHNDILNAESFMYSQLDIIALGVLLRVHAFLEEVLKNSCKYIQGIYSLKNTYKDMKRKGKFSEDRISTFEKCVIYINKSPLNTKVDLYTYNLLFNWNLIRNILVHDGGVISEQKAKEFNELMGLQTYKGHSQTITYNAELEIQENKIIEKPLKIVLTFEQIVHYILSIDYFLATLFHPNIINTFNQSQKLNNLINEFQDEEGFNKTFDNILPGFMEQLKNSEVDFGLPEGFSKDEITEDYLRESTKILINDLLSQ